MNVKKILIKRVDPGVRTHKGLFGAGCVGSACKDDCCVWGCDVDLASLKLIMEHRAGIEPLIGARIEDCFSTELTEDDDYIGGSYRETAVRESDGLCAFHLAGKRGCSLFHMWAEKGVSKDIVPTICRVYPITWHRGSLFIDSPLFKTCKCKEDTPAGIKIPSLFETQEKEILALFDIREEKRPGKKKREGLDDKNPERRVLDLINGLR